MESPNILAIEYPSRWRHFLQKLYTISSPSFQCGISSAFEGYGLSALSACRLTRSIMMTYMQVCSSFQKASQDRHVWSTVYRHCRLPRLPGPLPRHTARHLENFLKESIVLQNNWAQAIVKPVSIRRLHFPSSNDIRGTLFIGSWLVVAGSKQILCYNVESESNDGTIIYEASLSQIYAFSGAVALDSGEQYGAYLILQESIVGSQR